MEKLFISIVQMSISAGYLILAVLLVRFLLRKAPKSMRSFLWLMVGIRLSVPFSVESVFSLIPSTQAVGGYISVVNQTETVTMTGTAGMDAPISQPTQTVYIPSVEKGMDKTQSAIRICAKIWLFGVALMSSYMLISWLRLKNRVKTSVPSDVALDCGHAKIYRSDAIESPFLFGIINPRIYIPNHIADKELPYVTLHEMTHRKRKDYLIKPIAFLLLSVYWFNPCVWLAYIMLCKDIELICDEKVIRQLGASCRKEYSQALLNSAVNRRMIAACPVAFGEVSVKERVKNVLNYKKPAFWVLAAAVLACIIVPVCFMTQKKTDTLENTDNSENAEQGSDLSEALSAKDYDLDTLLIQEEENVSQQLEDVQAARQSAMEAAETIRTAYEMIGQWARAFCDRDAKTIIQLADEDVEREFVSRDFLVQGFDGKKNYASFGWSSPWPWGDNFDENTAAHNYRIVSVTDRSAEILYYAWTSDPHVTVWREILTYKIENGQCIITSEILYFMDYICTAEEFRQAYPGGITGTMMDYGSFNGAGESLNSHAEANKAFKPYADLFAPDTAAVYLLNILNNPNKVGAKVTKHDTDTCTVTLEFYEDGGTVDVQMIQPYGPDGIWVPYTGGADDSAADIDTIRSAAPYIITGLNVSDIAKEDAKQLEALFPDHHEFAFNAEFPQSVDLNGDGVEEKIEMINLLYNGGDGGYALRITDTRTGKQIPLPDGYTEEYGFPVFSSYMEPDGESPRLLIQLGEDKECQTLAAIMLDPLYYIYEHKNMYSEFKKAISNYSDNMVTADALSGCNIVTYDNEENPVMILKTYVSGFLGHVDTLGYVITELRLQKDNTWTSRHYFLLDSWDYASITQQGVSFLPFNDQIDMDFIQLTPNK